MSNREQNIVPILHQQLCMQVTKNRNFSAWARATKAGEKGLFKMLYMIEDSTRLSFDRVTTLFEALSIPIEDAISMALGDRSPEEFAANTQIIVRRFKKSAAKYIYKEMVVILSEYIVEGRSGISSYYKLGQKVGMRASHVARYFPKPGEKDSAKIANFGIHKLVQIAEAFDTNLPRLIKDAKLRIFRRLTKIRNENKMVSWRSNSQS